MTKTKKTVKTAHKTTMGKTESAKKEAVKKLIKQTAPKKALFIDHPAAGENLCCGHYSFRIGSPHHVNGVKLSINDGAWCDCRPSQGYWWYDWWNFNTGPFCAEATARLKDGREVKSAKRKFKVKP